MNILLTNATTFCVVWVTAREWALNKGRDWLNVSQPRIAGYTTAMSATTAAPQDMREKTISLAKVAYACIEANKGTLAMAGSMPLWLKLGGPTTWFPNDVDLYWYNGKQARLADGTLIKVAAPSIDGTIGQQTVDFKFATPTKTHTVETHVGKVQFILSSNFTTVEEILKPFDLTCCKIASVEPFVFTVLPGFNTTSLHGLYFNAEPLLTATDSLNAADRAVRRQKFQRLVDDYNRGVDNRVAKYTERGFNRGVDMDASVDCLLFALLYKTGPDNRDVVFVKKVFEQPLGRV